MSISEILLYFIIINYYDVSSGMSRNLVSLKTGARARVYYFSCCYQSAKGTFFFFFIINVLISIAKTFNNNNLLLLLPKTLSAARSRYRRGSSSTS